MTKDTKFKARYEIPLNTIVDLLEKAEVGAEWFNAYQRVDDFLIHHLGDKFPTDSDKPEENTINAICILAGIVD